MALCMGVALAAITAANCAGVCAQETCVPSVLRGSARGCHGNAFILSPRAPISAAMVVDYFSEPAQWVDWDGDGDLDRIWASSHRYDEAVEQGVLRQRVGSQNPFSSLGLPEQAYVHAADWDGDGDIDLLVGSVDGTIWYFDRLADGHLSQRFGVSNPFDAIFAQDVGRPMVVDVDGDGDLDLLVEEHSLSNARMAPDYAVFKSDPRQKLVERTGMNWVMAPRLHGPVAPHIVDWNQDGLDDVILGLADGSVAYLERSSSGALVRKHGALNPFDSVRVDGLARPWVVDWDGDGDPDVFMGSAAGPISYFENTDAGLEHKRGDEDPLGGVRFGPHSAPQAVDLDGDGRLDILAGAWGGKARIFLREPDGALRVQSHDAQPFRGIDLGDAELNMSVVRAVDWNGDGDLDLILGSVSGLTAWMRFGDGFVAERVLALSGPLVPQAIDLDGDGDLDMVVGVQSAVRNFIQGFCQVPYACSLKGHCDPFSGACVCQPGYAGSDCSACARHFFTDAVEESAHGARSCRSCPGLLDVGEGQFACNRRGVCIDDISGRLLAHLENASNTSVQAASGNGSCLCSNGFHGEGCAQGACATGHKLGPAVQHKTFGVPVSACQVLLKSGNPAADVPQECSQRRLQSLLGKTTCQEGTYSYNGSCTPCFWEGVNCAGTFPNGSSAPPMSMPGYYMVGMSRAERCSVEVAVDVSPCLGGQPFASNMPQCREGHAGLLCGACTSNFARDQGDQICVNCEDKPGNWGLAAIVGLDLLLRSMWALFLSKRAISSTLSMKTDAVLLRIWMHWVSANWVLRSLDFSKIELFAWSIRDDLAADKQSGFNGPAKTLEFPAWFSYICKTFMFETGSWLRVLSPQEALECLVVRTWPEGSRAKLLVPAMWWFLYPLMMAAHLVLLVLVLVKLAWPLWIRVAGSTMLCQVLMSYGFTRSDVEEVVKGMYRRDVVHSLWEFERSASLNTFVHLDQNTFSFQQLRQLIRSKNTVMKTWTSQETLEGPYEYLQTDDDSPVEPVRSLWQNVSAGFRRGRNDTSRSKSQSNSRRRSTSQTIKKDKPAPVYVVFGLFRNTSLRWAVQDIKPIFLVGIYSIWSLVTQRMLFLLQTKNIYIVDALSATDQPMRTWLWTKDMRMHFMDDQHLPVAIIGISGLALWSIGFPLFIFCVLKANQTKLETISALREYGYFYNGLEPRFYWWEILVKRFDLFCVYFLSNIEFVSDGKAKLILCGAIASIFWGLDLMAKPFDDRQSGLLDRMDDQGMRCRFLTLLTLQLMLMFNAGYTINVAIAMFMILINAWFVFCILFVTLIEIISGLERVLAGSDTLWARWSSVHSLASFARYIGFNAIGFFAAFSKERSNLERNVVHFQWVGPGKPIVLRKPKAMNAHGGTTRFAGVMGWLWENLKPRRIFRGALSKFFRFGEGQQAAYAAQIAGKILDHLVTHGNFENLSPHTLDFIFLLPVALQRLSAKDTTRTFSDHGVRAVIQEIHKLYKEARDDAKDEIQTIAMPTLKFNDRSTFVQLGEHPRMASAEWLARALLYLYRLEPKAMRELVNDSMSPLVEVSKKAYDTFAGDQTENLFRLSSPMRGPQPMSPQSPSNVGELASQSSDALSITEWSISTEDVVARSREEEGRKDSPTIATVEVGTATIEAAEAYIGMLERAFDTSSMLKFGLPSLAEEIDEDMGTSEDATASIAGRSRSGSSSGLEDVKTRRPSKWRNTMSPRSVPTTSPRPPEGCEDGRRPLQSLAEMSAAELEEGEGRSLASSPETPEQTAGASSVAFKLPEEDARSPLRSAWTPAQVPGEISGLRPLTPFVEPDPATGATPRRVARARFKAACQPARKPGLGIASTRKEIRIR